jgi:uncharacterized protein (UPF0332 family)
LTNPHDETLVRYRLEEAEGALDDARYLLAGGRTAQAIINRAYYAMFYAVLALLQRVHMYPRKHRGAISLFDTEFAGKGIFPRELSQDLHRAYDLRQASDYREPRSATREKAEDLVEKASRFVAAIRDYLLAETTEE